jgi:phospholipid/cholesterol/gamma-HCH transport system substrate-binding protein
MHRLIYSDKAGADFESTLANLDKILSQGTDVVGNLNTIIENTKEGQGTLGRLLIDPSIYDDLKLILSNVERNRILKALIRYSLEQKQLKHE